MTLINEDNEKEMNPDIYQNTANAVLNDNSYTFSIKDLEKNPDLDQFSDEEPIYDAPPLISPPDLEIGDFVAKHTEPNIKGKVVMIGELVEVLWSTGKNTMEYPEELKELDSLSPQEKEELNDVETLPLKPLEIKDY